LPLDDIEDQRRKKLEALRQLGIDVYPSRFARTHSIAQAVAEFGGKSGEELESAATAVRVAGRLVSLRGHGKTGFAHLSDGDRRLQIYIRQDTVTPLSFKIYEQLDLGDFLGARGVMFRTRTGELTVKVEELFFLAKALLPPPEKWHGLADIELRYRRRYLDLMANPEVREVFLTRSRLVREIRAFFDARGYVEVETPMLQAIAGGAVARPFKTFHNALGIELFLRIAPELYLKRLTVGGLERVYEINRNFRNEGISTKHNPEFTMLEFYEAYSDFQAMMDLTEALFCELATKIKGSLEFSYCGRQISFARPWPRLSMREAVRAALAERDLQVSEAELKDARRLREIFEALGAPGDRGAGWGKLLAELFEVLVEPALVQPTFIYDYPLDVSPLSKRKPEDPDFVERFELIVAGMECANGFSELNDPDDQRSRFEQQLRERERGDLEAHVMDEDYLRALGQGLPPTGGEGVGIDRLAMLFTDSPSIRDVILFPHLRPEGGREPGPEES
jgi:lysyl-tRNA synthetase class 2